MESIKSKNNEVAIAVNDPKFKIKTGPVIKLAQAALDHLQFKNTYVSIVFETDQKVKNINQKFLKHNWFTDVLAFPFYYGTKINKKGGLLGEVIISPKRAKIQSKEFGASFNEELARYVCHGILHLAGYKDKSPMDQKKMRRNEDQILAQAKNVISRIS